MQQTTSNIFVIPYILYMVSTDPTPAGKAQRNKLLAAKV